MWKIAIFRLNDAIRTNRVYHGQLYQLKFILFLGDLNILMIIFLILLTTLTTHVNTALHLLLTAELIWITLYAVVLLVGITYDCLNLLSLTFFFLIFSAVEFSIGLVLLLLQHLMTRTLSLDVNGRSTFKFNRSISLLPKTNLPFLKS